MQIPMNPTGHDLAVFYMANPGFASWSPSDAAGRILDYAQSQGLGALPSLDAVAYHIECAQKNPGNYQPPEPAPEPLLEPSRFARSHRPEFATVAGVAAWMKADPEIATLLDDMGTMPQQGQDVRLMGKIKSALDDLRANLSIDPDFRARLQSVTYYGVSRELRKDLRAKSKRRKGVTLGRRR